MAKLIQNVGIFIIILLPASMGAARSIYLNGDDVSSARNAFVEGANIRIDGDGNVFIIAPHYQKKEETTYVPLSAWKESPGKPEHKNPGPVTQNPPGMVAKAIVEPPAQPASEAQQPGQKVGSNKPEGEAPPAEGEVIPAASQQDEEE